MAAVACAGRLRKLFEELDIPTMDSKPMTSTNTEHAAFVVSMAAIMDEITTDFVAPTFDLKMIVSGQHYPPLDRAPDDPRDHPIKPDFANFPRPSVSPLQLPPALIDGPDESAAVE